MSGAEWPENAWEPIFWVEIGNFLKKCEKNVWKNIENLAWKYNQKSAPKYGKKTYCGKAAAVNLIAKKRCPEGRVDLGLQGQRGRKAKFFWNFEINLLLPVILSSLDCKLTLLRIRFYLLEL